MKHTNSFIFIAFVALMLYACERDSGDEAWAQFILNKIRATNR